MPKPTKSKVFAVRLEPALYARLDQVAAKERTTPGRLARIAIEEYLSDSLPQRIRRRLGVPAPDATSAEASNA